MAGKSNATGKCLCGKVKVIASAASHSVGACHCSMCRRWTGGPLMGIDCGNDVSFEGEEHIKTYSSSPWAERGFCSNCGTNLFYRLRQPRQYILSAGIFDDSTGFVFDHQIFIDDKPEYYSFSNVTKNMTGKEIFALYAPK